MKRNTLTYRFMMIFAFVALLCADAFSQDDTKYLERGRTYEWSVDDDDYEYRWELRGLDGDIALKSSTQVGNDFEYTFKQAGWYELRVYFQENVSGVPGGICPSDAVLKKIYVYDYPDFKVDIKELKPFNFCHKDTLLLHAEITADRKNVDPSITQDNYVVNTDDFIFEWYNSSNELVGSDTFLNVTSEDNYYLQIHYKYNSTEGTGNPDASYDDGNGFFVEEFPLPEVIIGGADTYAPGIELTIYEENGADFYKKYEWFSMINGNTDYVSIDESTTNTTKVDGAGKYKLIVTDEHGCVNSSVVEIDLWENIAISTAFSPNDDGDNDVLFMHGTVDDVVENSFSLVIYDRKGTKVFESNNINDMLESRNAKGWDGNNMFSGVKCPVDGYIYFFQLEFTDGQVFKKNGTIALLR